MSNHFIQTVPRLLSSERKQEMWSKKTLLRLLKASNIYGGLLSLITIPVLRYGDILALREPLFWILIILGTIGMVLGALALFAILRINGIRKLPGELRLKPEMWKTK